MIGILEIVLEAVLPVPLGALGAAAAIIVTDWLQSRAARNRNFLPRAQAWARRRAHRSIAL